MTHYELEVKNQEMAKAKAIRLDEIYADSYFGVLCDDVTVKAERDLSPGGDSRDSLEESGAEETDEHALKTTKP